MFGTFIGADGVVRTMWVASAFEEQMRESGWLTAYEASVTLNRPMRSIEALGHTGVLRTDHFRGQTFYNLDDVAVLRSGQSPGDVRDAEHIRLHGSAMSDPELVQRSGPAKGQPEVDLTQQYRELFGELR